jgi:hypothetical protein
VILAANDFANQSSFTTRESAYGRSHESAATPMSTRPRRGPDRSWTISPPPTSQASPNPRGVISSPRSVAQSPGVELTPVSVRDTDEMARNAAIFACSGNSGVIVTAGGTAVHRELIIRLAARYKLPSVYPYRYYAVEGGLIAYGPNTLDPVRRAAGYVDRILKGEKMQVRARRPNTSFAAVHESVCGYKADIEWQAGPAGLVAIDPHRT